MATKKVSKTAETIIVKPPKVRIVKVPIMALPGSQIIFHRFDPGPAGTDLRRHNGVVRDINNPGVKPRKKPYRDPALEAEKSIYYFEDGGWGFPCVGLKKAIATAGKRFVEGVTGVQLWNTIFIHGEATIHGYQCFRIYGEKVRTRLEDDWEIEGREDVVRLAGIGGGTDVRYRAALTNWWAEPEIEFEETVLNLQTVMALLDKAGYHIGLGENRPDKGGNENGRFRIAKESETKGLERKVA